MGIESDVAAHRAANAAVGQAEEEQFVTTEYINELEAEMMEAAEQLEFETAAAIRDRIMQLQQHKGQKLSQVKVESFKPRGPRTGVRPEDSRSDEQGGHYGEGKTGTG